MFQNIFYQREKNILHVWDDQHGYYALKNKRYAYMKSSNGDHVALDGTKLERVTKWEKEDELKGYVYESDIRPETRYLIDTYYDTDEVSTNHRVMFLDIEVLKGDKYSTIEAAANKISAISFYMSTTQEYTALVLDPDDRLVNYNKPGLNLYLCKTEYELLSKFTELFRDEDPSIVTGWNIDFFDIPYLYNRITNVCGRNVANMLSPIGVVQLTVSKTSKKQRYKIAGVSCLDYMALYKNFSLNEESSYALEAISQKELKRGKIQYDGDLDQLYKSDANKFIDYNINDVELVVELDKKLDFLELARGICHKGHVPYEDVYFASRFLDGSALTFFKRIGVIAPNRKAEDNDDEFDESEDDEKEGPVGAYVKVPTPGRYEWIYDLDMTSLYPSIIMTLNISPETKFAKVVDFNAKEFLGGKANSYILLQDGKERMITSAQLREMLDKEKFAIAANGVLYRTSSKGFLPTILDLWFDERVDFRNQAKKHHKDGNMEMYKYFDMRQKTQKVLLNSFYGVLGLPSFRFHDIDNAEAITLTGQQLIKYTQEMANYKYNTLIGTSDIDYCVYVDTDSTFLLAAPLIKKMYPGINTNDNVLMSDKILEVAAMMMKYLNESYDMYATHFHNVDSHRFVIKQEFIARSGLWVAKKRYAQLIINEEGHMIEPRLDVKGIDVVRSSFPKAFRKLMAEVLWDILNFADKQAVTTKIVDFREFMKTLPYKDVMTPTSVKNITKWTVRDGYIGERISGTPIHVKSALNYNDLLKINKIESIPPVQDGDKILWTRIRQNEFGMETIAITDNDDPQFILDMIVKYIDYKAIFESLLEKKLQDFYNALDWGQIPESNNLNKFFSFK